MNYHRERFRVCSIGHILEKECEGLRRKIMFTRILMLSEYKEDLQHRFLTKCCLEIVLHLTSKKNLEAILFILVSEQAQSNAPLESGCFKL